MLITRISISQPVFATMVMAALVVLGVFSYRLLPVEQMPDIVSPSVWISVRYPGAAPEAIETAVAKPIEYAINTVDGVRRIFTTIREGVVTVQVEFRMDADPVVSTQEIRDKIGLIKAEFSREVKDPQISRAVNDPNQRPVMVVAVSSRMRSLGDISTLADQVIVKRLQNAGGVGNVIVEGSAVRQVQIFLRPDQMQSYGVGIDQIIAAIQAENQDLPTGSITRGPSEQLVRVEGKIKTTAGFARIIVAESGGSPIYLGQVADVVDGEAEETSISRVDGVRAVQLIIFKVQRANEVEVGRNIADALRELRARMPEDVEIKSIYSSSDSIERSLDRVKETIVEGGLLTVFIVFLFLQSWRSTIITGLTLPISVIATFIALHAFGFTLNFVTLMALSLCIGLLIDDAIVVRENIVRHRNLGKSHSEAARTGTEEIALAVTATTFSILAVFIPIAFMKGIIGRYFFQFGITVAVAVLVSLFVSFTLDPMLSSVWPDPPEKRFVKFPWLAASMERIEIGMERMHVVYGRLLAWAVSGRRYRTVLPRIAFIAAINARNPALLKPKLSTISSRGIVVLVALGAFVAGLAMLPLVGTEFIPQADTGSIFLRLNTTLGSSLEYTDAKIKDIERVLRAIPEVATVSTTVATDDGKNYARVMVILTDKGKTHRRPQSVVEEDIRARIARMAGFQLSVGWGQPVSVSILGPNAAELTRLSQDLMAKIASVPGIADLESSEKGAQPTIAVRINNEVASDLGVTTARIGNALRPLIAGDEISRWLAPDGQEYGVIVQLPKDQRRLVSDLGDLYVTSSRTQANGSARLVPVREVAEFVPTTSAQQLKRLDLQRRVSISANAEGRAAGDVGNDVQKITNAFELPPGYRFSLGGAQENMKESFASALAALALAVIFIYLILASQFASFVQPIAIMASLPLALVGVILSLLATHTTLNMFSMIGFIMLMGLVTKNAILLVDFINQALRAGASLHEAIFAAGQVRLRPILMTTLAMIFGMLPMAIGAGQDGEVLAPMGRAVIGGVATSTLLTLIVVPVLYTYVHAITRRFGSAERQPFDSAQGKPYFDSGLGKPVDSAARASPTSIPSQGKPG